MKRVFALISVFALTLVAFGVAMNPTSVSAAADPAEGKFFVDPTLSEDGKDIPLYVMNSIYTTFPNYFDYDGAKGTEYEDKAHEKGRYFPWNETKIIIPQIGADGKPTGYRYTVYPDGNSGKVDKNTGAEVIGTGYRLWDWELVDGQVKTGVNYKGKFTDRGEQGIADPSLSTIRYNRTGMDIIVDGTKKGQIQNDGTPLSHLIFDGEGRMVRGMLTDNYYVVNSPLYTAENVLTNKEAETFPAIFCYENDVVVLRGENDDHCDRATKEVNKQAVDENGDPLFDENGNPVYIQAVDEEGNPLVDADGNPVYEKEKVLTDDPKFANDSNANRWMFQWYTTEQFETLGVKVNTVNYLQEGWLADRWDYSYEVDGGVMCLAIIRGMTQYGKLDDTQAKVHNASVDALIAAGEEAPAKIGEKVDAETGTITYDTYCRPAFKDVLVPKGGFVWDYGYLNRYSASTLPMYQLVYEMFTQGYHYGRSYKVESRAYNFSAKGLQYVTGYNENQSLIVDEENPYGATVEVLAGTTFKPCDVISISGMLGGFGDLTDVFSYKSMSASELEYTMFVNGVREIWPLREPTDKYTTWDKFVKDFIKDMSAYLTSKGQTTSIANAEEFFDKTYGKTEMLNFFADNAEKWGFLYDEITTAITPDNYGPYKDYTNEGVPSNYLYWRSNLHAYLNKTFRAGWPASASCFDEMADPEWIGDDVAEVFYYPTWDALVKDFLKDFNLYVYGKGEEDTPQIADAEEFWDKSYTADPAIQAKICSFFTDNAEKWGFLGEFLDAGIARTGWKSYTKDHYNYYRCNLWELLNKTKRTGWPASCGAFDGMEDPSWIGVPKVSGVFSEYTIDTTGVEAGRRIKVETTVTNTATGVSRDLTVYFKVVDALTPHLDAKSTYRVDTKKGIVLSEIAQAFDGVYVEGGAAKGSDISYLIDWTVDGKPLASVNLATLAEGTHEFFATIEWNGVAVSKAIDVIVPDTTAPLLLVNENVVVPFGSYPNALDLIKVAYDAVDGNYLNNADNKEWYNVSADAYDPTVEGESFVFTVTVYDAAGNSTRKTCEVTVGMAGPSVDFKDEIFSEIETIKKNVQANNDAIEEALEELRSSINEVKDAVSAGSSNGNGGCAAPAAEVYFVSIALAAAGALLLLKKKH